MPNEAMPNVMCSCGKYKIPYFRSQGSWHPLYAVYELNPTPLNPTPLNPTPCCKECEAKWRSKWHKILRPTR